MQVEKQNKKKKNRIEGIQKEDEESQERNREQER